MLTVYRDAYMDADGWTEGRPRQSILAPAPALAATLHWAGASYNSSIFNIFSVQFNMMFSAVSTRHLCESHSIEIFVNTDHCVQSSHMLLHLLL